MMKLGNQLLRMLPLAAPTQPTTPPPASLAVSTILGKSREETGDQQKHRVAATPLKARSGGRELLTPKQTPRGAS
jgi:hypothetical protein